MSNEDLGSMIVRVGLDGTDFDKGAKNLSSRMSLARSELKASTSSFDKFGKSIDGLKAKQDGLSKIYELQSIKVKQLKQRYDEVVKAQGENSSSALKLAKSLNYEIASYNKIGKELNSVKSEINDLNEELGNSTKGWAKAEKSLKSFSDKAGQAGQSMQSIGQNLTMGVTAPLAALGGVALKTASDLQASQGKIKASLGLTVKEAQKLNESAKEVWKDGFGENMNEVSVGITQVRKNLQNITGKELENVTRQAFILRDTFGYEIQESTRAAKALIDNFGVEGSKAMDYITTATQKGGDYSQELLDTISEYSVQFKTAGIGVEGMFNILIQGAEKGAWNLDKVGDAVKEYAIRAVDGSKTTAEGFKAIGLNAEDMSKKMAKGGDSAEKAFMATVAAISSMKDPLKQQQAGVALFGTQWEDVQKDVISALDPTIDMLGDVAGATDKAGKAIQDNFGTRVKKDLREIGESLLPLGEVLLNIVEPALENASEKVEEFTTWLKNLTPAGQKTVLAIAGIVAAIGPLLAGLGFVASGIGAVAGGLTLLTGPVGLTVAALVGLGAGFVALDKQMDKPIIKSDIFKGKISDATKEAVGSYMKLHNEAEAELNMLAYSQGEITDEMAKGLTEKYRQMGDMVLMQMKENHAKQLEEQQRLFDESNVLTEEEEAKRMLRLQEKQMKEIEEHNKTEQRKLEIISKANDENRTLTETEVAELAELNKKGQEKAIEELTASQEEQLTILNNMKNQKSILEAEEAGNTIKKAVETRDQVVAEAQKKKDQKIKSAEEGRDVLGTLTAEEAAAHIRQAENEYNQVVAKAEDMRYDTVNEAIKRAGEHADVIDQETGNTLDGYDRMYNGVLNAINWIRGLFNKEPIAKKGSLKETGRQKQRRQNAKISAYAKGTSSSGHPGGPAIVGEKGRELAHIPGYGVTLVGANGPELHSNLPRGTSVLPNRQTEKMLKSHGFPGYAEGIGDYFDMFLKGSSTVWDYVKGKFNLTDSLIPSWLNSHTGSPMTYIGDMAKNWIQKSFDNFFDMSGSYSGGTAGSDQVKAWIMKALQITNTPMSWLPALMTKAARESTNNPRAINLWDSNAKRGTPSKGLMQTIDPTFNSYKLPGMNDIWNPIHNTVAAIRYIKDRYGSVFNTPGIRSLAKGGGYKGYAKGDRISSPTIAAFAENGYPEYAITTEPRYRNRSLSLWTSLGQELGVPMLPALSSASGSSNQANIQYLLNQFGDLFNSIEAFFENPFVIDLTNTLDGYELSKGTYEFVTKLQDEKTKINDRAQGMWT